MHQYRYCGSTGRVPVGSYYVLTYTYEWPSSPWRKEQPVISGHQLHQFDSASVATVATKTRAGSTAPTPDTDSMRLLLFLLVIRECVSLNATQVLQPDTADDDGADCGDWTSCSQCVNTRSCYWAGGSCSSNQGGCGTSGCCSGGSGGAPTPAPTYDCSSCPELTFDCSDLAAACPGLHINCAKSTCGGGTSIGGIIGGVLGAMAGGILLRYLCRRYGNSQTATKKQPLMDADTEAGSDYVAQN